MYDECTKYYREINFHISSARSLRTMTYQIELLRKARLTLMAAEDVIHSGDTESVKGVIDNLLPLRDELKAINKDLV